ncbi:hypothetical protein ACSS6W_010654 [Trichoderma asperelloides]
MAQPLKMIHDETDLHRAIITTPSQSNLSASREPRTDLLCYRCSQDARYDVFQ